MGLGKVLKFGREQKGWTRQFLADELKINVNSLAKYERAGDATGQYPPFPTLARMVSKLELDTAAVFASELNDPKERDLLVGDVKKIELVERLINLNYAGKVAAINSEQLAQEIRKLCREFVGPPESLPSGLIDQMHGNPDWMIFDSAEVDPVLKGKNKENGSD